MAECRRLRQEGVDPIEAKRAGHLQSALDAANAMTFGQGALCLPLALIAPMAGSAKHATHWQATPQLQAGPL